MEKTTLDENFQVVVKVEKDLASVHGKDEVDNDKSNSSKKQSTSKDTFDINEQNCFDLENMSTVIERLANAMVDLKKVAFDNLHQFSNKLSSTHKQDRNAFGRENT